MTTQSPDIAHRMGRRDRNKNYRWRGLYHITVKASDYRQQPLGTVVGNPDKADGDPDAPHVLLTSIGRMVEHELKASITAHYPMVEIQDYVIMPEHLHFIVNVRSDIFSANGHATHLGQVIAGFKKGCNRHYWEMTGQHAELPAGQNAGLNEGLNEGLNAAQQGKPAAASNTSAIPSASPSSALPSAAGLRHAVYPHGYKVPSTATTGRRPLFEHGYVDVMPLREGQLEEQRAYIRNNPRSRLLRTTNRAWLQPHRNTAATALTLNALRGYLLRECAPSQLTPETWEKLSGRLLSSNGEIVCDSYGNLQLLQSRLLPVVCHRKHKALFARQKQLCLAAAEEGAVLVSARIAKGEQEIIDAARTKGHAVILVNDNGMPTPYHPSTQRIEACAEGRLLTVTPWTYHYRRSEEDITVAECKTMNCVVQSLCRLRDDWWISGTPLNDKHE